MTINLDKNHQKSPNGFIKKPGRANLLLVRDKIMKKYLLLSLLIFSIALISCDSGDTEKSGDNTTNNSDVTTSESLPKDEIRDILKDETNSEFNYSTISTVEFKLDLTNNDKETIDNAYVTVKNDRDEIICVTKSAKGKIEFKATVDKIDKKAVVRIQHRSYEERILEIDNINNYIAVDRTLYMANVIKDQEIEKVILTDEYTDDNHFIFARKKFIVAYEDLYPTVGDADFNDTVALLDITVYTEESMRWVNKVVIKTTPLANGAGFKQALKINIYGAAMIGANYEPVLGKTLIADMKQALTKAGETEKHANSYSPDHKFHNEYYQPEPIVTVFDFDPYVCTLHFPAMPFDPYVDVDDKHRAAGLEVHLPMVETPYTGKRVEQEDKEILFGDEMVPLKNFPWALVFPIDEFDGQKAWRWPLETNGKINEDKKSTIFKAYPFFKDWYQSNGEEKQGWYLLPSEAKDEFGNIFFPWIYTERPW